MPSNIQTLDKAVNVRQLKMVNDAAVHLDETAGPASEDVIDEYGRITASLYQALEDAQQVITPAQSAAELANEKALLAQQAIANVEAATSAAASAADAATDAAAQVEDARGAYGSLALRLDAVEVAVVESTNPMTLLS